MSKLPSDELVKSIGQFTSNKEEPDFTTETRRYGSTYETSEGL